MAFILACFPYGSILNIHNMQWVTQPESQALMGRPQSWRVAVAALRGDTHLRMMPQGSPKENRFNMIQYVDKDGKGFLEGQVHISREDQKK